MTRVRGTGRPTRRLQQRIDEAATFLASIWSDTPGAFGVLAYKAPSEPGFRAVSFDSHASQRAAAEAIQFSDDGYDVYTHLGLADEPPAPGRRLTSKSVTALNCVWAELDYGVEGHKKQAGPEDPDLAREVIDGFPLRPSLVVSSGNGFHCYWALEETLWVGNEQEEQDAAELLKCFGRGWQQHAGSRGYKADSVFDLPRILRVPGTQNHKDPNRLKDVTTERHEHHTYTLADIESVSAPHRGNHGRRGGPAAGSAITGAGLRGRLDRVLAGCAFMRHVEEDAATLPEADWFAAAGILARCRDGRDHFHRMSRPYPDYDEQETDKKFAHVAELEPMGCQKIHDQLFPGCRDCPFLGAAGSPADLAGPHLDRTVVRAGAPIRDASAAAWRGIYTSQEAPTLFRQGALIVQAIDRDGRVRVEPCSREQFAYLLVRCVAYMRKLKNSDVLVEVVPSQAYVADLLANPYPPLPRLRGISQVPLILPNGSLSAGTGYDVDSGYLMAVSPGLHIPGVPTKPSRRTLSEARDLLMQELLGEFDFVSDADRAHAIAALLWPFGMAMSETPQLAPLHLISKPTQGSGGSLLAKALLLPAHGQDVGIVTEAESDAEWRKRITALAMHSQSAVLIDNLRETLDSGALAAALTSTRWTDRVLGSNRMVDVDFAPLWIATGNNPVLSSEISRRTVQIRIDPRVDRPWQRQEWKHPHLLEWAAGHRGELIWAALVLWRNWIACDRPDYGGQLLGSYEHWSRTVGGVLESAAIPGFLENLNTLYEASDESSLAERTLLASWYELLGDRPVTARQVLDTLVDNPELEIPLELKGRTPKEQTMEIGKHLSRIQERRYNVEIDREAGTLHVEKAKLRSGRQCWRVRCE